LNLLRKIIKKFKSEPIYLYIFLYFILIFLLSFFRDANTDETYYIKEASLIAELLKNGLWIGDYGVGLHGFIFKLPIAIVFIILGEPSVFAATLFTILLSISSLILFYSILKRLSLKEKYGFWATVLLSVSFHFVNTSLSFNRDIPSVFAVLLFIYIFLRNKNKWLIGMTLLLMLDAKEHVFLTFAPVYFLFLFLEEISNFRKDKAMNSIKRFVKDCLIVYLLPFLWVISMFTTSIVPINMFLPSILGFTETGAEWNKMHFSPEIASQNLLIEEETKELPKISKILDSETYCNNQNQEKDSYVKTNSVCFIVSGAEIVWGYIGKILYPRTFSFISLPKIIALSAILYSIPLFKEWFKRKDKKYLLSLILWFNILAVILRASHGRYLLAVLPIFMIFFTMFIKDGLKNKRSFRNILIGTTAFVFLGLLFESSYLELKIILEIFLLLLLWSIWFLRKKSRKLQNFTKATFIICLSFAMFLTTLVFSYQKGQISNYLKYGYNRETKEIVTNLDSPSKIWINDYGSENLIKTYRRNLFNEPEWHWQLANWIPKKSLLKTYGENNTFTSKIVDMDSFREEIESNKIDKVVLIVSTIESDSFSDEEKLVELLIQDWLKYERKVELKNKIMYIFEVEN